MRKILFVFPSLLSIGCSCFVPWNQRISITTSDPNAKIIVDNRPVGTGHVDVELRRNQGHSVVAIANGDTVTAPLGNQVSLAGGLDIVGGVFFGIPFIGCFFPGFMDIAPSDIRIQMPAHTIRYYH